MSFFKSIWKVNSKHEKLSEELALQNVKESEQIELIENENDVITFKLKYLGSTVIEKIAGDSISTEAVKSIVKVAKASGKKLQRINIAISLKGIIVSDLQGNEMFKVSIYRISNCSTDPTHRQVFSFISTDSNETMECHAFICSKRKMTETVTLTVARAFSTAYEAWRILPSTKEFEKNASTVINNVLKENEKNLNNQTDNNTNKIPEIKQENTTNNIVEEKLIDFGDDDNHGEDPGRVIVYQQNNREQNWVSFDDDFVVDAQRCAPKSSLILV